MDIRALGWKFAVLGFGFAACAAGEVVDVADNGFTIKNTVTVSIPPAKAYEKMVGGIGKWWSSEHTFSGDAANLSIEARPQSCFCERFTGGGGVRHLTVVHVASGQRVVFEGGLGPLQSLGVAGSMIWKFAESAFGTTVKWRYTVGGYNPGGFKDLAPVVDSVLHLQIERYRRYAETGKP